MPTVSADGKTYTFTVRPGQCSRGPAGARDRRELQARDRTSHVTDDGGEYLRDATRASVRRRDRRAPAPSTAARGRSPASRRVERADDPALEADPTFPKRIAMPYFCATRRDAPPASRRGPPLGRPVLRPVAYARGAEAWLTRPAHNHAACGTPTTRATASRTRLDPIRPAGSPGAEDYVVAPALVLAPSGVQSSLRRHTRCPDLGAEHERRRRLDDEDGARLRMPSTASRSRRPRLGGRRTSSCRHCYLGTRTRRLSVDGNSADGHALSSPGRARP